MITACLLKPRAIILFIIFNLMCCSGFAQNQSSPALDKVLTKLDGYNQAMPAEKAYLQFDKPYYAAGDTIWFKAYLMNQALGFSPLSSRLYVELLNDSNAVVKHLVFPVVVGLAWGNIPLNADYIHDGNYTIRAYTNWMRNFGSDYLFTQHFQISNQIQNSWLALSRPTLTSSNGRDKISMDLRFTSLNEMPVGLRDLQFRVINGTKVLLRDKTQTDIGGSARVDFNIPNQTALKNLSVVIQDQQAKNRSLMIPVKVNRPQDIDVQFMPEGGSLVAGIPSLIGFKAIGEDGEGIAVTGKILDDAQNEIKTVSCIHNGMGDFELMPEPNKSYHAEINFSGGMKKTVPLPTPLKSGCVLRIANTLEKDSLTVSVYNTLDGSNEQQYYLIGQARGAVCYAVSFKLEDNFCSIKVAKGLFPEGVAHFILLNGAGLPTNERITYINRQDDLQIDLKTGISNLLTRDSIPVHISVRDKQGKPVVGSFSLAVTDDAQIIYPNASTDNICSRLLLSSDLKGHVEDPAYYLGQQEQSWRALDALLLTQGWVGYDLKKIGDLVKAEFYPETEFTVRGKVTNAFGKPVKNGNVMLVSMGRQILVKDTLTDQDGRFVFDKFPPVYEGPFLVSARNVHGRVINGGLSVDEKSQQPIPYFSPIRQKTWNVNADTTMLNFIKSDGSYYDALNHKTNEQTGRMLQTVVIKGRRSIKNSHNLNDPESTDQTLTEDVFVNAGRTALLSVIQNKVGHFHDGFHPGSKSTDLEYFIRDNPIRFIIDGVDLDGLYEPIGGQPNEHYEFQKQYLENTLAEDIIGIEVIYNKNQLYNAQYRTRQTQFTTKATDSAGSDFAYLEITTRTGRGPVINRTEGISIYKPDLVEVYRQFYRPRYTVRNNISDNTDLRSTIHWEPNIVTDNNGMCTVSFFAADKPTTYTIKVEGADMNGKVGYQQKQITIKTRK
ncbi:MAG: hypothetical protein JWQ66_2346 [Mucilaginibacter sp.]|nr:hypothetical protein [Mucilaginibacter sp.]